MSKFLSELDLRDDLDGRSMQLYAPLVYQSDVLQRTITVPAGFTTDFASVPQVFQNILPEQGAYSRAAVVHDFLYRTPKQATRPQADKVLLEAARVCGCSRLTCWTLYAGVRAFGWHAYKGGL